MSNEPYNPFAAPTDESIALENMDQSGDVLAGRLTRLGAAILDGIIIAVIVLPIQFASGFTERAMQQQVTIVETLVMSLLGIFVLFVVNGYTLANRGQTLGKIAANIQVVDFETGKLLSYFRVFVLRNLWIVPINIIVAFIPGAIDDNLVSLVALADALFIFGSAKRCIHDYIAGSKVVMFKPGREFLNAVGS